MESQFAIENWSETKGDSCKFCHKIHDKFVHVYEFFLEVCGSFFIASSYSYTFSDYSRNKGIWNISKTIDADIAKKNPKQKQHWDEKKIELRHKHTSPLFG